MLVSNRFTLSKPLLEHVRVCLSKCIQVYETQRIAAPHEHEISCAGKVYAWCTDVTTTNHAIIALKGTTDISDILHDLTWWPKDYNPKGDKVHGGFAGCAAKVYKRVVKWIEQKPRSRITLCGHSMGGSVAALLAYRLAKANVGVDHMCVITFGAPPFATTEFAKSYAKTVPFHIGFVLRNDPVPAFPLVSSLLLTPYVHVGAQYPIAAADHGHLSTDVFARHRTTAYAAALRHALSGAGVNNNVPNVYATDPKIPAAVTDKQITREHVHVRHPLSPVSSSSSS